MRTGLFVQVRLGSTRLPAKALLPLKGGSVIRHVMRSLAGVPADVRALLTDAASAASLRADAVAEGFHVFIGPELDVLARYCDACRAFSATRVVRATGDNPLVSAVLAGKILQIHQERRADLSHFLGCPWGSGVEVVEAGALFKAEREAMDPAEREHITTFIYRHPDSFTIVEEQAPLETRMPEARITVDTAEDYAFVKGIYEELWRDIPIETEALVAWLRSGARTSGEAGRRDRRAAAPEGGHA